MDWVSLTAALAFATFLFSVAFAFYSKRKVDARREDNDGQSQLCKGQRLSRKAFRPIGLQRIGRTKRPEVSTDSANKKARADARAFVDNSLAKN